MLKQREYNIEINPELTGQLNQLYINDLKGVIKTNNIIPTHTPKKFIDSFYLYWDKSTTYRLYIYINNEWKYTTLS